MRPFAFVRAPDEARAVEQGAAGATFIAGGTTLIDLMRLEVMQPDTLCDLNGLGLDTIEDDRGGIKLGAMARNGDVAHHPLVVRRFPALAQALLSGASAQLRNMATIGGNLLQRARCPYFRDLASPCNKRAPGTGCAALTGFQRSHAVLGTSPRCIATHPSDMCVALIAFDAVIHVRGPDGERDVPMDGFHTLPGEHPEIEHVLAPGELVTHVSLPASKLAERSRYLKVRDRASFAFALASAAVALEVVGGTIHDARIALGGVATRPWRARDAERALLGRPATGASYRAAAEIALAGATPRPGNAFKIELARRTIERALAQAGGAT